jgi:hypothetical protein
MLQAATASRTTTMAVPTRPRAASPAKSDRLFLHVGELADFSSALIVLAEMSPERLTCAQMVFFLLAGTADIAGKPATFTQIKETAGPAINRSLHTTYKVFLEGPNRKDRPNGAPGLKWLSRAPNPADEREKLLKLTPQGRKVIEELLVALNPENAHG